MKRGSERAQVSEVVAVKDASRAGPRDLRASALASSGTCREVPISACERSLAPWLNRRWRAAQQTAERASRDWCARSLGALPGPS